MRISLGYDPATNEPLAPLERYTPNGNNAIRSAGFMAEGGTVRQSFFVNSLTDQPFNIKAMHLYNDDADYYSTDIQLYCSPQSAFVSPLGSPRLRFYMLSPSTASRVYTLETDEDGDAILVGHLTLDEFKNNYSPSVTIQHAAGSGLNNNVFDNFLQTFDTICNIGTYNIGGALTYSNIYYNDQSNTALRNKIDFLVFSELPYNNINNISTKFPIGISSSTIRI